MQQEDNLNDILGQTNGIDYQEAMELPSELFRTKLYHISV